MQVGPQNLPGHGSLSRSVGNRTLNIADNIAAHVHFLNTLVMMFLPLRGIAHAVRR